MLLIKCLVELLWFSLVHIYAMQLLYYETINQIFIRNTTHNKYSNVLLYFSLFFMWEFFFIFNFDQQQQSLETIMIIHVPQVLKNRHRMKVKVTDAHNMSLPPALLLLIILEMLHQ